MNRLPECPTDALYSIAGRLAFLSGVFARDGGRPKAMSDAEEFGLYLILVDLEDDVKAVEHQLEENKEARS